MEVHEEPPRARSDAQNALRLDLLPALLTRLVRIHQIVREPQPDTAGTIR
jgi:3-deoxy-D-manno-octulosonic acid (KDO) 8-phosphate synthase